MLSVEKCLDGTGGRLDLIVNFDGTQEVLSSQESTRTLLGGYQETDLLLFTQDTVQKMSWFNFAEFRLHNGSALQLGIINFTLIESNSAANNYTFLFSFYGPFKTVEYDPNLSIVIQPSNGSPYFLLLWVLFSNTLAHLQVQETVGTAGRLWGWLLDCRWGSPWLLSLWWQ